ncbi:MAG: DUF1003 domain-containing protein [Parasphingorhabdus sp.]|nr:DUF1003 domain-containing protein [Parasphingorhabdus sp.]
MNSRRNVEELAQDLLGKLPHELAPEEHKVLQSIHNRVTVSEDASDMADERMTFGQRLSDNVAAVGGSWGFIIAFGVVLFGWMILNSTMLSRIGEAFDPYPFIFLNLMLSTLAAIQAPIIMMSQNRAAAKDRIAASHDYEVNLRAELDIIRLHQKMDELRDEKLAAIATDIVAIRAALAEAKFSC